MIRRLVLGAAVSALTGYLARSAVAARRARRWPARALPMVLAGLEPGERPVAVTVAVRAADGGLSTWTVRPKCIRPEVRTSTRRPS